MSRIRNITTALAAVLLTAPAFAYDLQTPGNDTKFSVYGFIYAQTNYTTTGSSMQQPTMDSVMTSNDASAHDKGSFIWGVQPSRFGFASVTPNATYGDITTKIEWDDNATTSGNGYHLRHAYATVGNWMFGQTWSNWVDLNATADAIDWQNSVGQAGYDTPRRAQIRYTFMLDKMNSLAVSLENGSGLEDGTTGTAVPDQKVPAIVAAYTYSDSWGHIGVRAMDVYHGFYIPANTGVGDSKFSKNSFAAMVSGDVKFGKDDLIFSVYDGKALGPWGAGLQVSQITNTVAIPQDVQFYNNLGWVAGYTHVFTPAWRANVYASAVNFSSNSSIPGTQGVGAASTGYGAGTGLATKSINDYAVNAFYSFNKNTQLGLEYFYEVDKTFGAASILQQDGTHSDTAKNGRFELVLQAKF
jgi:hypothetical protein